MNFNPDTAVKKNQVRDGKLCYAYKPTNFPYIHAYMLTYIIISEYIHVLFFAIAHYSKDIGSTSVNSDDQILMKKTLA